MHNRPADTAHDYFSLDTEAMIQAARPPHTHDGWMHFAITDDQEWLLRRDLARLKARRDAWLAEDDEVTTIARLPRV